MFFYIKIDSNNQVQSYRISNIPYKIPNTYIQVDSFPEGNILDYKYLDGNFIYNPLKSLNNIKFSQPTIKERVSDIELALADIYGGNIQ